MVKILLCYEQHGTLNERVNPLNGVPLVISGTIGTFGKRVLGQHLKGNKVVLGKIDTTAFFSGIPAYSQLFLLY